MARYNTLPLVPKGFNWLFNPIARVQLAGNNDDNAVSLIRSSDPIIIVVYTAVYIATPLLSCFVLLNWMIGCVASWCLNYTLYPIDKSNMDLSIYVLIFFYKFKKILAMVLCVKFFSIKIELNRALQHGNLTNYRLREKDTILG